MDYGKDLEVLDELKDSLAEADQTAADGSAYTKEQQSDFSSSVMPFADITVAVMAQTENLYRLTGTCDRFSGEYKKLCKLLTKAVDHLGSCCLTNEALKSGNIEYPELKELSVARLYKYISFNFRKCEAALNTIYMERKVTDPELFSQLLTFANMLERLRATEQKAVLISLGYRNSNTYISRANYFSDRKKSEPFHNGKQKISSLQGANAYDLRYDVIEEAAKRAEAEETLSVVSSQPAAAEASMSGGEPPMSEISVTNDGTAVSERSVTESGSKEENAAGNEPAADDRKTYIDVLNGILKRSRQSADGALSFTEDETEFLLCDPEFNEKEPALAKQLWDSVIRNAAQDTG